MAKSDNFTLVKEIKLAGSGEIAKIREVSANLESARDCSSKRRNLSELRGTCQGSIFKQQNLPTYQNQQKGQFWPSKQYLLSVPSLTLHKYEV